MTDSELSLWKGRITRAEGLQSQQHPQWKEAIDLINCIYFSKRQSPLQEQVDVNFANAYYNNLQALLYFRDPFIFVKSKNDKYLRFAETLEEAINAKWADLKLKYQFKRVIGSASIMPPGWIKIGYTAKIGKDVAKIEDDKEKGLLKTIKDAIKGVVSKKKESEDKLPEEQGILNMHIQEESVFATWVPSWNMLMPEGYYLISDMPWLCEWEDVHVEDFIANPFYKNKENLEGFRDLVVANKDDGGGQALRKVNFDGDKSNINDSRVIRLFHVWDRRSRTRFTLSKSCSKPHFEGEWPYDMPGFPYEELVFEESLPHIENSNPYPVNVITPILPQIIEQSQARTQMSKWRKRSSAIIMAQKGLLTEDDMNQLEETEALQICYISNVSAVQMSQTPPLPNGVFEVDSVIKEDLQMMTNMGQLMFAPQKGTRTATQAKIGEGGLQLKISAKQDCVEDLTVRVARKLAQLMWQFYDRKQIEELIGEDVSQDMWPDLPEDRSERRRVIQQMQIRIDAGSAAPPKDDTVDKKQLLDFASIMMNIAPDRFKKDEFAKQMVKKFKFTKEVDKLIISNDDEEEKAAEEENSFLLANHPQIVSPNTNHEIHLKVHSQAMAQGGNSAALHQHILDHAKFLGIKTGAEGQGGPQQGDMRPPMKSTNPEIVRKGNTTQGDIMQSAQNLGAGSRGVPRG